MSDAITVRGVNAALRYMSGRFPMTVHAEYGEFFRLDPFPDRIAAIHARVGLYDVIRHEESREAQIINPRDGLAKMLQRFADRVWYVNECREAIRDLVDQ